MDALYPFIRPDAVHCTGLYLSESEGARYWLEVLAGLNNRGIKDILTACANGLAGFDEAVRSIFPQTGVQLCVTRQIRNSLRCVASKGQKAETQYTAKRRKRLWTDRKRNGAEIPESDTVMAQQTAAPVCLFPLPRNRTQTDLYDQCGRGGTPPVSEAGQNPRRIPQ
ncbi:hypothetical protein C7N83_10405 [Neisseria iguanae]|uniref:Mutator family transposase n=1 Tax=Neisseria iguanae TaxID=90242 RepID=A0A2P7TYF0_9NEIS|nr:hypothetical protein C7N83_10405 [Neisseria iguanae]